MYSPISTPLPTYVEATARNKDKTIQREHAYASPPKATKVVTDIRGRQVILVMICPKIERCISPNQRRSREKERAELNKEPWTNGNVMRVGNLVVLQRKDNLSLDWEKD